MPPNATERTPGNERNYVRLVSSRAARAARKRAREVREGGRNLEGRAKARHEENSRNRRANAGRPKRILALADLNLSHSSHLQLAKAWKREKTFHDVRGRTGTLARADGERASFSLRGASKTKVRTRVRQRYQRTGRISMGLIRKETREDQRGKSAGQGLGYAWTECKGGIFDSEQTTRAKATVGEEKYMVYCVFTLFSSPAAAFAAPAPPSPPPSSLTPADHLPNRRPWTLLLRPP